MNSNTETDANYYLKDFERRLQAIERRVAGIESSFNPIIEDKVALYLTVPDSLRKSLFAVFALSKATAEEVCIKTGRHRSIENKYLNELVRAGWLKRERIGKKVYYSYLKKKEENSPEGIGSIDELDRKLEEILS